MGNTIFYFSRIYGNKVYGKDGHALGKLVDFEIAEELKNPRVVALKIKDKGNIRYLDAGYVTIDEIRGQYVSSCMQEIYLEKPEKAFSLAKYILDKQIIDINGRKVVRVNDIKLAVLDGGIFAMAVDIGMDGLLRRLGFAKPLKKILQHFNTEVSNKLLLWDNVDTLLPSSDGILLSKAHEGLSTMHPSDLADILEEFDSKTAAEIFSRFDNSRAADVLEEMESDAQVGMLKAIDIDKAADILEEMPPDEAADILDDLKEEHAEELLNSMEKGASAEVRELMEYDEDVVGSLMSTEFISFKDFSTVQTVIDELRETKPEEESIYYLYVTDSENRLCGVVSLRNLIVSEPRTALDEIMDQNLIYAYDQDSIKDLILKVSKYSLMAIPVVDRQMQLLGMVVLNDVIYELIKGRK